MSSTNRGKKRSVAEFYPTPAWCVRRLFEAFHPPAGHWCEPFAGDGAIVRAVNARRSDVTWDVVEHDVRHKSLLEATADNVRESYWMDYFACGPVLGTEYDVVITNPPFSRALDFLEGERAATNPDASTVVILLLSLGFFGAQERAAFFQLHMPDLYILPNRPSFTGSGSDSVTYAWFVWRFGEGERTTGKVRMLELTSKAEIVADREARAALLTEHVREGVDGTTADVTQFSHARTGAHAEEQLDPVQDG
jgi:hypothetical protein